MFCVLFFYFFCFLLESYGSKTTSFTSCPNVINKLGVISIQATMFPGHLLLVMEARPSHEVCPAVAVLRLGSGAEAPPPIVLPLLCDGPDIAGGSVSLKLHLCPAACPRCADFWSARSLAPASVSVLSLADPPSLLGCLTFNLTAPAAEDVSHGMVAAASWEQGRREGNPDSPGHDGDNDRGIKWDNDRDRNWDNDHNNRGDNNRDRHWDNDQDLDWDDDQGHNSDNDRPHCYRHCWRSSAGRWNCAVRC